MDCAMRGGAVCGHQPALAPLPLCRAYDSRWGAFRPQAAPKCRHSVTRRAAKGAEELQLVKREETDDGSILFVFGDEAAAAAHQKESSASQPTSKPEEPAKQPRAPAESRAVEAAQPEADYEKARGKKVKEAVKEAKVKDGAETSDMVEEAHQEAVLANGMVEEAHQDAVLVNGALLPDFEGDEDPDELLSDEDAPDLQDEIAKTLTSLKVKDLKEMCKERKIKGYSAMRKSQLVRTLKPILAEEL